MSCSRKVRKVLAALKVWIYKVRGSSLAPEYRDGEYVVCWRPSRLAPGRVVVFDHPNYGRLIKRVERIEADGRLFVLGDDIDSIDSRTFGAIDPAALLGTVVWHIKKPTN